MRGKSLGYFCKEENRKIAEKMREYFAAWIDNGHNNFEDENTIILQIRQTNGTLVVNNAWIDIDF